MGFILHPHSLPNGGSSFSESHRSLFFVSSPVNNFVANVTARSRNKLFVSGDSTQRKKCFLQK